jgi:hypothetical protein
MTSLHQGPIGKAELPGFSWFDGSNDRMIVLLPMLAGVPVLRVVTTADRTADEAGSEVHPVVTQGHTPFTNIGRRIGHSFESPEVVTGP